MKIIIIVTFYLISGPVDCSDVIGYSGGSVIIFSDINWYASNSKYICKVKEKDCTDIIRADTKRHQVQDGRFLLYSNSNNKFLVLIRKLKPQDAGTYRFGLENQSNSTVNLTVHNNSSCGVPKVMNTYAGQNITISCNYPVEYEKNYKYVLTVNDDSSIQSVLNTNTKVQNGRFSISDDKSAKVLSVNISDVREDDELFYLIGVWRGDGSVRYYTFFTDMWLHVTDTYVMTSEALTETQSISSFSPSVIISLGVCVALLLIGIFALMMKIYKLRHKKTQDYTHSAKSEDNKHLSSDYNTDPSNLYENVRISSI